MKFDYSNEHLTNRNHLTAHLRVNLFFVNYILTSTIQRYFITNEIITRCSYPNRINLNRIKLFEVRVHKFRSRKSTNIRKICIYQLNQNELSECFL